MKFLQRLAIILLVSIAVFVAGFSLWGALSEENWAEFLAFLTEYRFSVCCYSMALFCVALLLVLPAFQLEEEHIKIASEQGNTVNVSRKAILDSVRRVCSDFSGINHVRPSVDHRKGHLNVTLNVRLKTSAPMQALVHDLTRTLRQDLNSMDLIKVGEIIVNVESFAPGNKMPVEDKPEKKSKPTREVKDDGHDSEPAATGVIPRDRAAAPESDISGADKPPPDEDETPA